MLWAPSALLSTIRYLHKLSFSLLQCVSQPFYSQTKAHVAETLGNVAEAEAHLTEAEGHVTAKQGHVGAT